MRSADSHTALKYAALAQVYRWTQVYETDQNAKRLSNVLNALSDDFVLYNVDGTWRGKEKYLERLGLIRRWENAHHIRKVKYKKEAGDVLTVETEGLFQIVLPDSHRESYDLRFFIKLKKVDNALPLITEITATPVRRTDAPVFERSYFYNRATSFFYYWMHHMEKYKNDAYRIEGLLASDYKVEFGSGKVFKTIQHIADWMYNNYAEHSQPSFSSKYFSVRRHNEENLMLTAEMSNKGKTSAAAYEWILRTNPDDPFASIKEMKISPSSL